MNLSIYFLNMSLKFKKMQNAMKWLIGFCTNPFSWLLFWLKWTMFGKYNVCNVTELEMNREIWWDKIMILQRVDKIYPRRFSILLGFISTFLWFLYP